MPVLVTAAHRSLARRIAVRLLQEGGEVRVTTDGDAAMLRAAGAFVASVAPDDEGRLEAALEQVHTVVHVGGGIGDDPARSVAETGVVVRAARGAGVRRLVLLSLPGSTPVSEDPLRRAKAAQERLVAELPGTSVVLRLGLVDTPQLRDLLATGGIGRRGLATSISPVAPEDVTELVAAFDRARSSTDDGHLVVRAEGPVRTTVADYLAAVGTPVLGTGGSVGRRLPSEAETASLVRALAGPWHDDDPTLVDGWGFAGIAPRPPGD